MKKYILYIIPLLTILTGCDELDTYPRDAVSSEVYFSTADQLEQYSNQFYTLFPSAASMYSEVSDEIAVSVLADEIRGARVVPADASGTNWNWSMLRHINYMIEHAKQCEDPLAAQQYVALARFFRAYLYFDKVRHYGDVPWVDHTLGNSDEELYKPRDSRTVVMNHVIEDLDFAIANMTNDKSNVFAVNRYTAMALKSRACLFEGTFCKYHNVPNSDWQYMLRMSVSAAEQLFAEGGYKLYDAGNQPYRDLFSTVNVQAAGEYILARGYSSSLGFKHNASSYTTSATTGKPGFTKRFVNQYLNSDGTRFTDIPGYDTITMANEMSNRDPRMQQTIFRPGHYVRVGETEQSIYSVSVSATGYQLIKYVTDASSDTYNNSDRDMPLFRLAEVYLNYAEAKAELGEFTQADADLSINKLRDRVKMPHLTVANVENNPCKYMQSLYPHVDNGKSMAVILEVRRERDIELVEEGFRYWDLMRWKEGQAFNQPYLGMYFPSVSKSDTDYSGMLDVDGDGYLDVCVWVNDYPFRFGVDYFKVNEDIILTNGVNGGYILTNGSMENPTDGRQWREDRDYLYPIPVRERVLSKGALTQNPGWDDGLSF